MFERVLIVDDNKLDRFITVHALKRADAAIECKEYESAVSAIKYLEMIREQPDVRPQLIILDINMPELDGLAFLEKLALIPGYSSQCSIAIMLSSELTPTDLEWAKSLPFTKKFIDKPFNASSVAEIKKLYLQTLSMVMN